ncbi:3-oxoacyl-[acyl-carrier protein] reductase [Neolewinella xylanilytica]|uniref:3-oxoacyl-[acyl-carrier protein] reductase n=1 Tax=Neolewinella xylanilytica TaxID=1514080 RepID=A0A2S6I3L1_9BACT|nr:SDR family NAD(P)-dependent oxidoreductase [Neolewinella xylanilytica]PPK85772.1 3-oxoacyl-[acyl-carrier protein] reductase [Neolewinella xylanilytica]
MNPNIFSGKTAIVTGAATGIGLAIAEYLICRGATVVVNDLDAERTESEVAKLNRNGPGKAVVCAGDASRVDFVREMVAYAANIPDSRLELVVANAGLTEFGSFFDFSEASFDKVVGLNLKGTFFLTQAAARYFREQGSGGRIVLIGSTVGNRAYPNLVAYGMSKAGIAMLAEQLTLELAPLGVTVNTVSPGATLTERTAEEEPDYAGVWSKLNPDGRVGLPKDVAAAVGFFLGPGAAHITGQQILVDGGWSNYSASPFFVDTILEADKKEEV